MALVRGLMKIWFLAVILLLLPVLIYFVSSGTLINYADPTGPLFAGDHTQGVPALENDLTVVSYNLYFSEDPDGILADLGRVPEIDILLLQEADELTVERISQALAMNYVYYPSSIHSHGNNFGNGILSRWPLSESEKIILPHLNPRNGQLRIATKAIASVGEAQIQVYSVHFEMLWLGYEKRMQQIEAQIASINPNEERVIVGGDFNTITSSGLQAIDELYKRSNLIRATEGIGPTTRTPLIGFAMDHMYSRGLRVLSAGVFDQASGSDHLPIWVLFEIGSDSR